MLVHSSKHIPNGLHTLWDLLAQSASDWLIISAFCWQSLSVPLPKNSAILMYLCISYYSLCASAQSQVLDTPLGVVLVESLPFLFPWYLLCPSTPAKLPCLRSSDWYILSLLDSHLYVLFIGTGCSSLHFLAVCLSCTQSCIQPRRRKKTKRPNDNSSFFCIS